MSCTRMPAFVTITNNTSANKPITLCIKRSCYIMAIGKNDGVFEGDKPNPFLPLKFPKFGKENGYPIDKNPV